MNSVQEENECQDVERIVEGKKVAEIALEILDFGIRGYNFDFIARKLEHELHWRFLGQ